MNILISIILITLTLNASMFSFYKEEKVFLTHKNNQAIKQDFRKNVKDVNAIIKRGDYKKVAQYKKGIDSIIKRIDTLDLSMQEKQMLKKDIQTYTRIINDLYTSLQRKAPHFNLHYKNSVNGISGFNKGLISIGYGPLLSQWHALTKTKNRFIKKPSKSLERKFYQQWTSVEILLTELYLDEEMEEPLLAYMAKYKTHFHEVQSAYAKASYSKIKKLKPLSYKIKSQLEFLVPYKS